MSTTVPIVRLGPLAQWLRAFLETEGTLRGEDLARHLERLGQARGWILPSRASRQLVSAVTAAAQSSAGRQEIEAIERDLPLDVSRWILRDARALMETVGVTHKAQLRVLGEVGPAAAHVLDLMERWFPHGHGTAALLSEPPPVLLRTAHQWLCTPRPSDGAPVLEVVDQHDTSGPIEVAVPPPVRFRVAVSLDRLASLRLPGELYTSRSLHPSALPLRAFDLYRFGGLTVQGVTISDATVAPDEMGIPWKSPVDVLLVGGNTAASHLDQIHEWIEFCRPLQVVVLNPDQRFEPHRMGQDETSIVQLGSASMMAFSLALLPREQILRCALSPGSGQRARGFFWQKAIGKTQRIDASLSCLEAGVGVQLRMGIGMRSIRAHRPAWGSYAARRSAAILERVRPCVLQYLNWLEADPYRDRQARARELCRIEADLLRADRTPEGEDESWAADLVRAFELYLLSWGMHDDNDENDDISGLAAR